MKISRELRFNMFRNDCYAAIQGNEEKKEQVLQRIRDKPKFIPNKWACYVINMLNSVSASDDPVIDDDYLKKTVPDHRGYQPVALKENIQVTVPMKFGPVRSFPVRHPN